MAANSIGVWACSFYMFDEEGNEILNKDGSVKVFDAPDLDWSHIAEYVELDDLEEVSDNSNSTINEEILLINNVIGSQFGNETDEECKEYAQHVINAWRKIRNHLEGVQQ